MAAAAVTLESDDIQAIVFQGYGRLRAAAYILLELGDDTSRARTWLAGLEPSLSYGEDRPGAYAVNLALTPRGLRRLGVPEEVLRQFSLEFQEGMTSPHRRRLLGDEGAAAPEQWAWGGPGQPAPDAVLLVYAPGVEELAERIAELRAGIAFAGLGVLAVLDTEDIGSVEHFGFTDGVSQPVPAGTARTSTPLHTIAPGEFVLGYDNEHGQRPASPLLPDALDPRGLLPRSSRGSGLRDLGRNGSYLVLRQLRQDVRAFWSWVDSAAGGDDAGSVRLAARMVGRWPSGAALAVSPDRDDPEAAGSNDFGYASDAQGLRCPLGAHVRRTNPRESLPPKPGTPTSVAVGKRHRLLRRGREYGPFLDRAAALGPAGPDEPERGLHFVCLCADLARQFEFVQHTWAMNPNFSALYADPDPLLGGHTSGRHDFTVQRVPVRTRYRDLPSFVTPRGGAYFFLPGRRAVRWLSSGSPSTR
ncbi:Dyp-type peroxidase family [Motilibacter rhizosphaerae]|uniref:Dyp-type peroxidase family n=1 Tax=Motilibacter rhizosphaerae TaxID=598652 RepID=A0A4Q7NBX2_9ACTN|nr:hypothetical protein [Motilibacter rhizosphaerae]RZS80117.1 Dyp-type peroxidase family [Motilibacter rhizosphaerae]